MSTVVSMQSLPTVLLKPGEANRVVAGHPWIYRGSVLRLTKPAADGSVVQVKDHRQRFLGVGFYNAKSKIVVRLVADHRMDIEEAFFERRVTEAWEVRRRHLPNVTSCRVVNSESDFLSGLIVDKYEDVLVAQFASLGMDCRKNMIVPVLQKLFSPRAILERSDMASRKFEGLDESSGVLLGESDGLVTLRMNGLQFKTNLLTGHKTGMYLDQQVNYKLTAELAHRIGARRALDCFCFQGAFSLHLAKVGLDFIEALDQSDEAIQCASDNASLNQLADRCEFKTSNVFDWLKRETTVRHGEKLHPKYDIIILDPPSFTRNRASVPDALRGYKEIHLRAFKLLKPGGALVTYCCSHHVNEELFREVILAASFDARIVIREVARFLQSPDHPVIPSIPETTYLKGYALERA